MTKSDDNPRELIGPLAEYLDGEPVDEGSDASVDLTGADPKIVAEHLFLDGLLRRLVVGKDDDVQARVRRAMTTIERQRRQSLFRIVSVAAAAILVALFLWTTRSDPSQALEAIARHARAEITRQYAIEWRVGDSEPVRASFYAFGVEKMAFHIDRIPALDMFGVQAEVWFGSDGKEGWVVPSPPMPVFVVENAQRLHELVARFNLGTSFLQITKILVALEKYYDVKIETGPLVREWKKAEVPKPDKVAYVTGTLRPTPDRRLPERIEIEADFFTGTVHRMTLTHGEIRMVIDLVAELDESELALDWYDYDTHRDASQAVIYR